MMNATTVVTYKNDPDAFQLFGAWVMASRKRLPAPRINAVTPSAVVAV